MNVPVKLGDRYRDPITGFEGVAIARAEYLYGCARVCLQAMLDKDGNIPEPQWIDEMQLAELEPDKQKGGPRPDPPSR